MKTLALCSLLTLAFAVGCADPAPEDEPLDVTADAGRDATPILVDGDVDGAPAPIFMETRVGQEQTVAGLANRVTCRALGPDGVPVPNVETVFEVSPNTGWRRDPADPQALVGERVGRYQVFCSAPAHRLRDTTGATWAVVLGQASRVQAQVEPTTLRAGGSATVLCEAEDEAGNALDTAEATVTVTPAGAGVSLEGRTVRITTTGTFQVDCALPGVPSDGEATLTVTPNLPAQLVMGLRPELPVYSEGAVVTLSARVTDAFGNSIEDAAVRYDSDPALTPFGQGRFRLEGEGRYTLNATVEGETEEQRTVSDSVSVLVDSGGPGIECESPALGEAVVLEGDGLLRGRVADAAGLSGLTVDGQPVDVDGEGRFEAPVEMDWGLNVHEVVAEDSVGNQNATFCAYFAADAYAPEAGAMTDGVSLVLTQRAVDDGAPDNPVGSLFDLLRRVIRSDGLRAAIDQTLQAQNPVLPPECRQYVLGLCVFELGAEYRSLALTGPNTATATLQDGGLRVQVRLQNLALGVQLLGTVTNAGVITVSEVSADLLFSADLANGRPRVRLSRVNSLTVGTLGSDFEGLITGSLIDLVFWAFEGTIRTQVTEALRSFLETQVNAILSDVLSNLDLAALSFPFEIPAFGPLPATTLNLGVGFSSLSLSRDALRLGLAPSVTAPERQGADSPGVALPPGERAPRLVPSGSILGAVYLGTLNLVLHRLWRAGLLQLDDPSALVGTLPEGVTLSLRVLTPPALRGREDGRLEVHLGPATGELSYPPFIVEPVRVRVAAVGSAGITIGDGNTILVDQDVRLEALHLAVEGASMRPEERAAIEEDLGRVVTAFLDDLTAQLPPFAIPDFQVPDALVPFGLPRGSRLGLANPELSTTSTHIILNGEFR